MRIPLFDIDWTLLKGGNKASDGAFAQTLFEAYKVPKDVTAESMKNSHGKIDNQILTEIAVVNGIAEEQVLRDLPDLRDAMEKYFFEHEGEAEYIALPGVKETLEELRKHNIPIGVLTGNLEPLAWHKLQRAGIREYFEFGAFGNMAYKRVNLVGIAFEDAVKKVGLKEPITQMTIIGDSPLDIACAQDAGIFGVAVASGKYTEDDLKKTNPDLLITSLEDSTSLFSFLKE